MPVERIRFQPHLVGDLLLSLPAQPHRLQNTEGIRRLRELLAQQEGGLLLKITVRLKHQPREILRDRATRVELPQIRRHPTDHEPRARPLLVAGGVSLAFAPELVAGTPLARVICVGIALWWGGRLLVLPWLRVWPELRTPLLRTGFVVLHAACAIFAAAYGWLAVRGGV